MKKITLAFTLLSFAAQAQDFPFPYCSIANTSVEAITSVTFGGTTITNTNSSSILIDKTATVVDVMPEDIYTITVKGDTSGNFDNDIVAFIDWNQNGILDDEGEIYAIGTLSSTSGYDDTNVFVDITIPTDAASGPTRIRITKVYGDDYTSAVVNPCAISMEIPDYGIFPGYGQALDFTLNVAVLSVASFDIKSLSVYPNPAKNILNVEYKSILNAVKIYNLLGQQVFTQNTNDSKVQIDVSTLSAGAYIVKLFTEEGEHSFRAIKQ